MAALVFADNIAETSTTTGTGAYALLGQIPGYRQFSQIGNGAEIEYSARMGLSWEVGIGTYNSAGNTLSRTLVLASTNANLAVNWGAGTKTIVCAPLAAPRSKLLPVDRSPIFSASERATGRANLGTIIQPQLRLSLTTNVPVTSTDVTAATAIKAIPFGGNLCPVWHVADGEFKFPAFSELSLTLDSDPGHTNFHLADRNFDVFGAISGGNLVIGTGPTWNAGGGSNTARGTGAGSTQLTRIGGLLVNANSITLRIGAGSSDTIAVPAFEAIYIGTVRTTSSSGQTEDSKAKRFLWNAFNRVDRPMSVLEATANWSYSTAAYRQANAAAGNKLEFACGQVEEIVRAQVHGGASNSTATARSVFVGIGLDVATQNDGIGGFGHAIAATFAPIVANFTGFVGLGYHTLFWVERGNGTDTQTWYGATVNAGISGTVRA